jgi:hypothetical protein
MLAEELPNARFVRARGILEWRLRPERLDHEAIAFVTECWRAKGNRRRARPAVRAT